jgi:hypothetical protein
LKIGLVGPTHEQRSLPWDAQRSINLYPVFDQQGKEIAALYGTPGKELFTTCGAGPVRGMFSSNNGRGFVVSGFGIYEVFADGTNSLLGILDQSFGIVTMAENLTQLAVCDGASLYTLIYATGVFSKVTDPDLPTQVGTVENVDGYFMVNQVGTGRFYISTLNDGSSWAALDFATAESAPDKLVRVIGTVGQVFLIGSRTVEIWSNTGASDFPFRRITGAMDIGTNSPYTALSISNTLFFVGQDAYGNGMVYKTQSFSPQVVSNPAIDKRIQEATDPTNMRAWAYQEEGSVFYVLTGGGLETSLVYDISTQQWHERAHLNIDGVFEQDLAVDHMFIFGKHLVGDRRNGKIYEQSLDFYSDAGDNLAAERVYTHLSDEGQRIRFNALEIGFETGVGLQSGQGSNPLVSLSLSKDGARTWSDTYTTSIGAVGQYQTKVEFRRLGIAEQMTFKIRITDPVKRAIIGSYLK